MRSRRAFSPSIIVGVTLLATPRPSPAAPARIVPPVVMGYYPSYAAFPDPSAVRFDRFSDIIQAFVTADAHGHLQSSEGIPDLALTAAAHAHGTRVWLALGGAEDGENFGKMVRDPGLRAEFIADAVALMVRGEDDGLSLDWESPTADDKQITTDFVRSLRTAMRAANPKSELILAVSSQPNDSQGFDGPQLRDLVDYLQIMTYDFHGPWNDAGHTASLFAAPGAADQGQVDSFPPALAYWRDVQGFRPRQILMGIVGYGRGFKVRAWGEKPQAPSAYPEIAYRDILPLIGHGWTRGWDDQANAPWLEKDDGSDRISYDDEESVADKARWMKGQGLPGFFIWESTQESVGGDNPLTAAAQNAWRMAIHPSPG